MHSIFCRYTSALMNLSSMNVGLFNDKRYGYFTALLLLLLAVITIKFRNPVPYDETRYLAVAWEMWRDQQFLIPHLNGEIYADKPPLLFWLININWYLAGVNEWFPRAIPFIFSGINIFLTGYIASILWPEQPQIRRLAPLVLFAMPVWFFYSTPLLFDMLQVCFVLISITGLLKFHHKFYGTILFGVATGLGFLLKGPVIFLYVLPLAILLPFWNTQYIYGYGRLTIQILAALLLSLCIILMWIVPVIYTIGFEKLTSLFWHQTADRIVNATSHSRPLWWYLYFLPLILFPWFYKKESLKLFRIRKSHITPPLLLCLLWLFVPFVLFSLIDAKQLHYLLPLLPALSLLFSCSLANNQDGITNGNNVMLGILYTFIGTGVLIYTLLASSNNKSWVLNVPVFWTFITLISGFILLFFRKMILKFPVFLPATLTICVMFSIYTCVLLAPRPFTNLKPFSQKLATLQSQNIPLGNIGTHREQFEFMGRLKTSIDKVDSRNVKEWARMHPDGFLIAKIKESELKHKEIEYYYSQPYRFTHVLLLISSKDVIDNNYKL